MSFCVDLIEQKNSAACKGDFEKWWPIKAAEFRAEFIHVKMGFRLYPKNISLYCLLHIPTTIRDLQVGMKQPMEKLISLHCHFIFELSLFWK